MTNGTWVTGHVCESPKLFLIEGDQSNSICKSQIVNYVQELSEHENHVFHEEKDDVWGYLTTYSHCKQGSSKEGVVLGTHKSKKREISPSLGQVSIGTPLSVWSQIHVAASSHSCTYDSIQSG